VHETDEIAGLAVQGPTSYSVLSTMGVKGLEELKPFGLIHVDFQGTEMMVS
jgi:aminomethyltransferase